MFKFSWLIQNKLSFICVAIVKIIITFRCFRRSINRVIKILVWTYMNQRVWSSFLGFPCRFTSRFKIKVSRNFWESTFHHLLRLSFILIYITNSSVVLVYWTMIIHKTSLIQTVSIPLFINILFLRCFRFDLQCLELDFLCWFSFNHFHWDFLWCIEFVWFVRIFWWATYLICLIILLESNMSLLLFIILNDCIWIL